MIFTNLYFQVTLLVILFIVFNYSMFEMGDTFLKNPRLKKAFRIPMGILNTLLSIGFTLLPNSTSLTAYICIGLLLFVEFYIFYKDLVLRIIALVISFLIHIMVVRAIIVGIFAIATEKSVFSIVNENVLLVATMNITFIIINIMLFVVRRLLLSKKSSIFTEHKEQLIFLIACTSISCIYFFYNTGLYSADIPYTDFGAKNQLAISITLLCSYYVVMAFSIMVGRSVYYREKSEQLTKEISKEQQFRDSVTSDALVIYEVNLTKDIITKGFENIPEVLKQHQYKYSKLIEVLAPAFVYKEDLEQFFECASRENILRHYYHGKVDMETEYRRLCAEGSYIWVRAITTFFEDDVSGDIYAFVYVRDINEEKITELELKSRAERDSLTGLYDKGTTQKHITDFINQNGGTQAKGALIIIDVDNFKNINDGIGHKFGDTVLCRLADSLRAIFRSSEDANTDTNGDIIGRVGGDEFMVFIKNTTGREMLAKKAESIRRAFNSTYTSNNNRQITISASIGIAIYPQNGNTFEHLYTAADSALYQSKNEGKDTYSFYSGKEFLGYKSHRDDIDKIR